MKTILPLILLSCAMLATSPLAAQCISDDCGDIFADWAILNEGITVCEGVTFEVENQTLFPNIDFYVWDWGNGERDTVYEVSNHFYTYDFSDGFACAAETNLIIYNISLEIYRTCETGQSCHTQLAPVAVRLRPRANFSLPEVTCSGEATTIYNETCGAGDYLWTFADGTTSNETHPQHVFDRIGEEEVTLIVSNECGSDTIVRTVNVVDPPLAEAGIDETQSIYSCGTTVLRFTNNSANAQYYRWAFPAQASYSFLENTNASSPNPVVQFTNSGTYRIYLTVGNDCSESNWETTVEVVTSPTVALRPIPTSCDATTITLMDYADITGTYESLTWAITGPENITVPDGDNPVVTFSTAGDYTIQLTANSLSCPNSTATTSLQIQSPEETLELLAPATEAICSGSSPFTLSTSLPGGEWSGLGVDPSTGVFDPAVAGVGNHTIHYTVSNRSCQEEASIDLEVLANEQLVITAPAAICANGSPLQLTTNLPGGVWSGAGITNANAGTFNPSTVGVGTSEVTYSLVNELNCHLEASTIAEVREVPRIEVTDNHQVCSGRQNLALTELANPIVSPAGGTLTWSGAGIVNQEMGILQTNGEGGTYALTVMYSLNGCHSEAPLVLEVRAPVAPVAAPNQVFCQSQAAAQLQASPAGGSWSGPGIQDPLAGTISPAVLDAGNHVYTYTLDAGSECEVSTQMEIAIWDETVVEAGAPQTYCLDETAARLPLGYPLGGSWSGPGVTDPILGTLDFAALEANRNYTYEYHLEVDGLNCALVDQTQVRLYPTPDLELNLPAVACVDAPVSLLVRPERDVQYTWHFADGTTYSGPAVQYAFATAGTETLGLTATTTNGCVAEASTTLTVATPPVAQIVPSVSQGCEPLDVAFANNSQGNINSYLWDFGNGFTSTDEVPDPQAFISEGFNDAVYHVSLLVSGACGEDRTSEEVLVHANELRAFFNANTTAGCVPLTVDFQAYTAEGTHVVWNFGNDYTGAGENITHTFDNAGNYSVLQVADNGCDTDTMELTIQVLEEPTADFTHVDQVCPDDPVAFTPLAEDFQTILWDFGDGNTSTARQPNHQYAIPGNYTVTMTLNEAAAGCPALAVSEIEILERPNVAIAAESSNGCPPLDVCFAAESENARYYEWNFGDGNGTNSLNPCYTFTDSGTHPVTLRAVNDLGCASHLETLDVRVYEQPEAKIIAPEDVVCGYPQDVQFHSASSDAAAHRWTFSNGLESQLTAPEVTFREAGAVTVTLLVENAFGCIDQAERLMEVAPRPIADFGAFYENDCVPQDVVFDNFSTDAYSYLWIFGDGEQSNKAKPVRVYEEPGEYDITLIVGNEANCFDTLTLRREVALLPRPSAAFSWEMPSPDYEGLIQFRNESTDAVHYFWDFGDGGTSSEVDPLHDYRVNGNWTASLLAEAENGCTDTARVALSPELVYGLHFPNAFSPETGEGDVRVFKPAGIGIESWELEIFSPWGQRVFQSTDLINDQPGVAWNGEFKGKILPQGAYAYKASVRFLNGVRQVYTGSVTLLR